MSKKDSMPNDQQTSKRTVRNSLNYDHKKVRYQKFTQPSATIPDQSLSIREILLRHTSGRPIGNVYTPIYDGENYDMPDPRTLDLAERQQLAEEYKAEIADIAERRKPKPNPTSSSEPEPKPNPTPEPPAPKS